LLHHNIIFRDLLMSTETVSVIPIPEIPTTLIGELRQATEYQQARYHDELYFGDQQILASISTIVLAHRHQQVYDSATAARNRAQEQAERLSSKPGIWGVLGRCAYRGVAAFHGFRASRNKMLTQFYRNAPTDYFTMPHAEANAFAADYFASR